MKRGEVWWINFESSLGGEIRKKRPAVIVSNNASNQFLNRVQVIPITSRIDKLYPSESSVTFRGKKAKAMADQITLVSKKRLMNQAGTISRSDLEGIERAIFIQLDL
ncbi:MAG: type II toxin-antitoxin system PemK/MazF family toxin [Candidatus Aminicenantes bacterium]|nr:type II toxin-antitoxin system PemK/MazF family toxin [Candidatus Aminicenantes bacterium]